jgi:hypothetical protein
VAQSVRLDKTQSRIPDMSTKAIGSARADAGTIIHGNAVVNYMDLDRQRNRSRRGGDDARISMTEQTGSG